MKRYLIESVGLALFIVWSNSEECALVRAAGYLGIDMDFACATPCDTAGDAYTETLAASIAA